MKLYVINSDSNKVTVELMKKACIERGVEFIAINPDEFNYAKPITLEKGDMLYRISTGKKARMIEKFIYREDIATFYTNSKRAMYGVGGSSIIHMKNNLPIPKTIFDITRDRNKLKDYVEMLGGFPIILKAMGGSHGVGVMKIDSFSSLFSVIDFASSFKKTYYLREFIHVTKSARLIVLDGKVIDSIQYSAPEDDFRSNAGEVPNVSVMKFSPEIENTAIEAVKSLDVEFGGVDILIDDKNKHYITEVNYPCYFPRCQVLTGTDIAGQMVDHLIKKSKTITNE